jgi:hypothetical protein
MAHLRSRPLVCSSKEQRTFLEGGDRQRLAHLRRYAEGSNPHVTRHSEK